MSDALNIPNELFGLERAAEEERAKLVGLDGEEREAQWRAWRDSAVVVQAAITEHAAAAGISRYEVEKVVKQAVRHPEPGTE
ncbi:hypothetical protein AB0K09_05855 [Streptomyces sp. NPDC049577]|uniref:hypothetical protein n=1 Tax=Streptomyces sp. NPDC049577 TaxID=3155153 RepID=UPI003432C1A4